MSDQHNHLGISPVLSDPPENQPGRAADGPSGAAQPAREWWLTDINTGECTCNIWRTDANGGIRVREVLPQSAGPLDAEAMVIAAAIDWENDPKPSRLHDLKDALKMLHKQNALGPQSACSLEQKEGRCRHDFYVLGDTAVCKECGRREPMTKIPGKRAGSLEQKEGAIQQAFCAINQCSLFPVTGSRYCKYHQDFHVGPEPVAGGESQPTSASNQRYCPHGKIIGGVDNCWDCHADYARAMQAARASEKGKAPAPEPIAIPQKRQPDDVPRAGEPCGRPEPGSPCLICGGCISTYDTYGVFALGRAHWNCIKREACTVGCYEGRPAALPTNAEAQAPVSAEAMEWLQFKIAEYTRLDYPNQLRPAREILTALRALGAAPAKP